MTLKPFVSTVLLLALLSGCAGSSNKRAEPKRLLLSYAGPVAETTAASPRARLVVRGVSVPDYLDRRELVRRRGSVEVVRDSGAVWAERPAKSITRWITAALAAQRSDYNVESYTTVDGRAPDAVVAIALEGFEPGSDGTLRLRGSWIYAVNGKVASKAGRFDADAPVADDSPESYIAALQQALASASNALASELPAPPAPESRR